MIYAVGDIHGMASKLTPALAYLRETLGEGDRAVFLGDYIDRGPDSFRVIYLLRFKTQYPNTVFLRGNHEELLLNAWSEHDAEAKLLWLMNGGQETLKPYGLSATDIHQVPGQYVNFFESTLIEYGCGRFAFVHAGLPPPGEPFAKELRPGWDPRLWIGETFVRSLADFGRIVVFGHTPQRTGRPLVMPNKIGIDTGAVFGGKLTILKVDPIFEGECSADRLRFVQF